MCVMNNESDNYLWSEFHNGAVWKAEDGFLNCGSVLVDCDFIVLLFFLSTTSLLYYILFIFVSQVADCNCFHAILLLLPYSDNIYTGA